MFILLLPLQLHTSPVCLRLNSMDLLASVCLSFLFSGTLGASSLLLAAVKHPYLSLDIWPKKQRFSTPKLCSLWSSLHPVYR